MHEMQENHLNTIWYTPWLIYMYCRLKYLAEHPNHVSNAPKRFCEIARALKARFQMSLHSKH